MNRLLQLLRDEDGPTAVEYAFMLALIVAACIISIGHFGQQTQATFLDSSTKINAACGS